MSALMKDPLMEIGIYDYVRTPFRKITAGDPPFPMDNLEVIILLMNAIYNRLHTKYGMIPEHFEYSNVGVVLKNTSNNVCCDAAALSENLTHLQGTNLTSACISSGRATFQSMIDIRNELMKNPEAALITALASGVDILSHRQRFLELLSGIEFTKAERARGRARKKNLPDSEWLGPWMQALAGGCVPFSIASHVTKKTMAAHAQMTAHLLGCNEVIVDKIAALSYQRAFATTDDFADNIIPVGDYDKNTGLRDDVTIESVTTSEELPPIPAVRGINPDHPCQINGMNCTMPSDGGAMIHMASVQQMREKFGAEPFATIRAVEFANVGAIHLDNYQLMAGLRAMAKCRQRNDLKGSDFALHDIHEPFACSVEACRVAMDKGLPELGIPAMGKPSLEKLNVNGGAIAKGHPYSATMARQLGEMAITLKKLAMKTGDRQFGEIVTCADGGQGAYFILEAEAA